MVIEMLLNNDIQLFFIQMTLNFQKEINVIYFHNKWGGLMVRVFASILKVKGSNFMSGVMCGQQWNVDQIFSYWIPRIHA